MIRRFFSKIIITAIAVIFAAYQLKGIYINSLFTAVIVAIVLALLNNFIKPVLIFLTLPVTIVTLGLFLLVINVVIVKWTDDIVSGFEVNGWLPALLFSFIVSAVTFIIDIFAGTNKKRK